MSQWGQEVWELYQDLSSRFVYDLKCPELVFEIHNVQCTRAEARELLAALIMIHKLTTEHHKTIKEQDGE